MLADWRIAVNLILREKAMPFHLQHDKMLEYVYVPIGNVTAATAAKLLQSCLTLFNPIDGSPPGSTVPGIVQARTLEWVAISFSNA